MKKNLLKGTLLLGSMFILAACGAEEEATESVESEVSTVVEEEEVESEETTEESEESEESTEEETSEESGESTEEESSEESEGSTDEESSADSEESADDAAVVGTDESAEAGALTDGEYSVVGNPDERGWAVTHTITVADGEITDSNFDYENEDGDLKSEDEEYNTQMEEVAGVSSADATQELNDALVESQSADVDVVSGATSTSTSFQFTSQVLLELAAQGNTEEVNVDELELADGEYTAEDLTITVEGGEITDAIFEAEDQDVADELAAALVEAGNVEGVEPVEGQEELSTTFIALATQATNDAKLASLTADEADAEESSEESEETSEESSEESASEETSEESSEEESEESSEESTEEESSEE